MRNLQNGKIKSKDVSEKLLNIYFEILTEINKLREHQKHFNEANSTVDPNRYSSSPIYYLDSGFAKRFSYMKNRGLEDRVNQEVRKIMGYKRVLMLYFPQM